MLRGLRTNRIPSLPLPAPVHLLSLSLPLSPSLSHSLPSPPLSTLYRTSHRAGRFHGMGICSNFRAIISIRATLARTRANVIPFIIRNQKYGRSFTLSSAAIFLPSIFFARFIFSSLPSLARATMIRDSVEIHWSICRQPPNQILSLLKFYCPRHPAARRLDCT